mmetsp:Transcript_34290/g.60664  ORF Transcript_34290/g.60664 Transcript_34290/m.60664 type:complete len:678 (+) Transcript_34290:75-2108(+)
MTAAAALLLLLAASPVAHATQTEEGLQNRANPIRKVVNMLTAMQTKVTEEGEKEAAMHEKFMCQCKTGKGDLEKSIAAYEGQVPQTASDIEEKEAKLAQTKEDLASHQTDRDAAKAAIAEATSLREKEAAEFAKEAAEQTETIKMLEKAIEAISAGLSASFLQTPASKSLKNLIASTQDLDESDRSQLLAFLQGEEDDESPGSSEIVGILKQMGDEMNKDYMEDKAKEAEAVKAFEELTAAKKKEVAALTAQIEKEIGRVGDLGVEIVTLKNSLEDAQKQLIEDKEFLAKLNKDCATAQKDFDAVVAARSQEVVALAETIKILNDDDALELFKKTLPSASASFVQMQVTSQSMRTHALDIIRSARRRANSGRHHLDFIALALHGKKIGFETVIKMIDEMIGTLKEEQSSDDHKVEFCTSQFEVMADKEAALKTGIADIETALAEKEETISALTDEISALKEAITALDTSVAEATETRKAENKEFTTLLAEDSAAKELLGLAKNRLQKFYNPKLYEAPAAAEAAVLLQVARHKKEDSSGVLHMIDVLVKDLDKEITVAKAEEEDAQEDYETLMADAKEKRAGDSKALANKESARADLEADLQSLSTEKDSKEKELMGVAQVTAALHSDCDWLMKYFDVRKTARADEVDSLSKAKAVLSGADYSLLQQTSKKRKFLRRY